MGSLSIQTEKASGWRCAEIEESWVDRFRMRLCTSRTSLVAIGGVNSKLIISIQPFSSLAEFLNLRYFLGLDILDHFSELLSLANSLDRM